MMRKLLLLLALLPFSVFAQKQITDLFIGSDISMSNSISDSSTRFINSLASAKVFYLNTEKRDILLNNQASYQISIPTQKHGTILVDLEPVNFLASDFKVLTPKGPSDVALPSFYRGKIVGKQKSFITISVTNKTLEGMIISEDYNYTIGPVKNDSKGLHMVYQTNEVPNKRNFEEEEPIQLPVKNVPGPILENNTALKAGIPKNALSVVGTIRVALEADFQTYYDWGYNLTYVVNQLTTLFNNVSLLYANENINLVLSSVFVWTSTDPYADGIQLSEVLELFAKKSSINSDLAHLVSTRQLGGGLAYISSGTSVYGNMPSRAVFQNCADQSGAFGVSTHISDNIQSVPTYSWNVNVIAHELGHNFGLPHTHSCTWPGGAIDNCGSWAPEGSCTLPSTPVGSGTIMSYCHTSNVGIDFLNGFGQQPGDKMRAEVAAVTCLSNACSAVDFAALRDLYFSTNGDNWTNRTGWDYIKNNTSPPSNCSLSGIYGVTSGVIGNRQRVVKIELANNNLVGSIPQKIGTMVNLEVLNLSRNQLSGTIRPEFEFLSKLQKLNLSHNQLTGAVEEKLGNLSSLYELYLNNNQLSGCYNNNLKKLCYQLFYFDISTGNAGLLATWANFCLSDQGICPNVVSSTDYTALRSLYLSTNGDSWTNRSGWDVIKNNVNPPAGFTFNGIYGVKSDNIGGVERVTRLALIFNNLSGSLPTSIGGLAYLKLLHLGFNQLTGVIPTQIGSLTELQTLNIRSNQLSGSIPSQVGSLVKLTSIELQENQLTGSIPTQIGNLSNIILLDLGFNKLTGSIPVEFGNVVQIIRLYLPNNQLTGAIPTQIGNLVNLREMDLRNNQLSGSIPTSIGNLVNLFYLFLNTNQLSGTIPTSIGNLTELATLWLNQNQLTGAIPASVGNLKQLTGLNLQSNQLTGTIPTGISDLSLLVQLVLGDNKLTGTLPSGIGNLKDMEFLGLNDNQLSGSIPSGIGNLSKLTVLLLGNNQLSGAIPASMGNLLSLTNLGLYNNLLTGAIPSSIGNLTNLTYFALFNNKLSGSIPPELGKLVNTGYFYLNDNQLTGTIPGELGELSSLNHFSLENNQLSGCYSGNLKKLCAYPGGVSNGNVGLLATWANFCSVNAGICPCAQSLSLQSTANDFSSGTQLLEVDKSSGYIQANNKISGNANITYRAGKYILLTNGFTVNQGTIFRAEKGGCN